ncbi:MAG TPA: recombination regulator RecX [Candidatus Ignatzschineria merdigallinarum]|uniref:Regulatory protein RecX n=1 Tax=Candidatus Ignatzschineria merdigallinarum TaxID=2838621 RepID=A0A9D1Q3J0_9GAMM|nr:recombination regulator RecX [Candidatus Ignatzschineria merdigallinarum]
MEKDLSNYFNHSPSSNSAINKDEMDEEALLKLWRYWRERAMNFLVRREHSEVELRQKLTQRECPLWLLDDIVDWLYDQKYLSLERFAYSYSKNRADLGYGPLRVRNELSAMHQIASREIDAAFLEVDWYQARKTAQRKIRQTDPYKFRAALYRRGFAGDDYVDELSDI